MNKILILLTCCCLVFSACKRSVYSLDNVDKDLKVTETEFDYLSAKVKIEYQDGLNDVDATTNIRMKNDSIIWFSMTPGLGIEASRGIITTDSIVILDKIKKTYSIYTFEEVSQILKIDLNFKLVQSAILGNLIFPYSEEEIKRSGKFFTYKQEVGRFMFDNFIGNESRKIEKLKITDQSNNNSLVVDYANFQIVDDQLLPYEVKAHFDYFEPNEGVNKYTVVDIVYNKAVIENKPLRFPFNIPQKYVLK